MNSAVVLGVRIGRRGVAGDIRIPWKALSSDEGVEGFILSVASL